MTAVPGTLTTARWLRGRGFSIIPLDHPADPIADSPKQIGKVPALPTWEQYQTEPADDATLARWFGNGRQRNIGIVCGAVSGIVAIDIDSLEAKNWAQDHLPFTPMKTRTATGEHWYYRHCGTPVRNKARIVTTTGKIKLDCRGDGGYVVAPGSLHASGVQYERLGDWKTPLDSLPVFDSAWIAPPTPTPPPKTKQRLIPTDNLPPAAVETRARAYLAAMGPAIEGQGGDAHTFRAAGVLVNDFGLDDATAFAILHAWNQTCVPPWNDAELDTKIRNGRRYGSHPSGEKIESITACRPSDSLVNFEARNAPESSGLDNPDNADVASNTCGESAIRGTAISDSAVLSVPARGFPLTDLGNAEYFAALYGNHLRYDHRRERWLVWSGHRWQPDADAAVYRHAATAIRRRLHDAARLDDSEARARVAKWALSSESRGRLEALIVLARTKQPIADAGDRWDTQSMLLGVPNGVIDLTTGQLRAGQRDDRITMCAGAPFISDSTCPRWEQFQSEIFAGDASLVAYVQKVMGYSLTGDTSEQILILGHGIGSNGKGTLYNTFGDVLGDYAYSMPFSTVEMQQRGAIPNDLAALDGRRYATASETNDGTRLNESRIKALTGCDPITARFLHGEFFTFRPQAKFWLAVNHKPVVRDDSFGFWRRIRLLPFTETFPVTPGLAVALRAEYPGILAWAVRGCLAWQREGLTAPTAVLEATATFETDSDVVSEFLNEATTPDPTAEVRAAELYKHYKEWADRHGLGDRERLTATAFGRKLTERFRKVRTNTGAVYLGLSRRHAVTGLDE